jgi:hypothetical protein
MKSENKTIKILLSIVAFLLVLNLGVGLINEKTAKASKPVEYAFAISDAIAAFSNEPSDVKESMEKFTKALNAGGKDGWRMSGAASAVTASNPSLMRIYAILER